MVWLFFILLAFCGRVACGAEIKKHVQNSVYPYDLDPPSYNIESWVKQLHLQQCALVEVGDKYYAIFVESRPRRYDHEKGIKEYFLGLCDDDTLNKWSFCAASLQRKRADDCNFYTKNMYNTRVHRRLCDLTLLALNAPQCDCSSDLSDSKLYKVQGFPTCFKPPLPTSLCGDNNVCGLAGCSPRTINKRVHSIKCDRKCNENQPFCEPCDKKSSLPRHIKSFWTDWSNPYCTDSSCISQFDEAICINRETGRGDIDCLGPGTSCCTPELQNCKCHVYEEGGTSKVFRTFSVPQPEMAEYMSEEDFINSIPVRYLKEEFHKYPGHSSRTVRSNFGRALKETLANIYDSFPLKFGNTRRDCKNLKKFKSAVLKPYTPGDKNKQESSVSLGSSESQISTRHIPTSIITSIATKQQGKDSKYLNPSGPSTHTPSKSSNHVPILTSSSTISNDISKSSEEHTEVGVNIDYSETINDENTVYAKVSTVHEVNANPVDTFSTKPTNLELGECEPCKRHLNPPRQQRPHVNTNGIHHKSRIHEKHHHNYFMDYTQKRNRINRGKRERNIARRRKKLSPMSKLYNKVSPDMMKLNEEDEETSPLYLQKDDPCVLILGTDNFTIDTKRHSNSNSHPTLKKKLSFDLIFDDTKVPQQDFYQKSKFLVSRRSQAPVQRRFASSKLEEKAVYEQVTPKFVEFLERGELNTPKELSKLAREADQHLAEHFYARVPNGFLTTEDIPQFGYFSRNTAPPTTQKRRQHFHSEMDDEDFITDESGLLMSDRREDVTKIAKTLPTNVIVTKKNTLDAMDKFKHRLRNLKRSDNAASTSTTCEALTVTDSHYDSTDCLPEKTNVVREDDEEDALEIEDTLTPDVIKKDDDENLNDKSINLEDETKQITKEKNPRSVNHNVLEDEDEKSRTFITANKMENEKAGQPDILEDEDLKHPAANKKPSTECDKKRSYSYNFNDISRVRKQDNFWKIRRYDKTSSEEISDDDEDTDADDEDDVALEYDEDEKNEKITTTENMLERGEDKSVNEKLGEMNNSLSNYQNDKNNEIMIGKNQGHNGYRSYFYLYIFYLILF